MNETKHDYDVVYTIYAQGTSVRTIQVEATTFSFAAAYAFERVRDLATDLIGQEADEGVHFDIIAIERS